MYIKPSIQRKLSRLTILLVALLVLTAIPVQAANPNPGILPPNAHPFGLSYGEWSTRWWQWALAIPAPNNPLNSDTGENCGEEQSGHVWFLGGTFSLVLSEGHIVGTATRDDCKIPVGNAVFFPVLNAECSTFEGNGTTEQELRDCARSIIDAVTIVDASIDGVPVNGLNTPDSPYRVESPLFDFTLPPDNVFGLPTGGEDVTTTSVSDGYWLMLAPLSAGIHEIVFHGFADLGAFTFELNITYHLNVVPGSELKH